MDSVENPRVSYLFPMDEARQRKCTSVFPASISTIRISDSLDTCRRSRLKQCVVVLSVYQSLKSPLWKYCNE